MPIAEGYPKSVKRKGKTRYVLHRGGKAYSARQLKAYYATGGWSRPVRKKRKSRKRVVRRSRRR